MKKVLLTVIMAFTVCAGQTWEMVAPTVPAMVIAIALMVALGVKASALPAE